MKITKANLVVDIAVDLGVSQKEANRYFEVFLEGIAKQLENGNAVDLTGFGKFDLAQRGPRVARNPKTGDPVDVPASTGVKFRPAKALKERVGRS